jgi:CHAT domain-containing protein
LFAPLRELSAATGQKAAALYTLIGSKRFYLLLVTPDEGVKVFQSSVSAAALNEKILKLYALLQSLAYDPRPVGKELYNIILKPAAAELKKTGAQTLLWMLDGTLRYVPVSALWDGRNYLLERYQNLVFTRASREQMTHGVSRKWEGAGFGSSREHTVDLLGDGHGIAFSALPGVIQELQSVFRTGGADAGILDGDVYFDGRFTKDAFYSALRQRRPLVHVASHFSFRPGDNARSFMLLGDGTVLPLSEMKTQEKLFDGVELLTLSACNTAATRPDARGREIDGFAELAQRLGARAVMATLWQVSDESTPWLMKEFYAGRESQPGLTKAEALRRAQLALLDGSATTGPSSDAMKGRAAGNFQLKVIPDGTGRLSPNTRADVVYVEARNARPFNVDPRKPFAHPYIWSPFVLYGNGR